MLHLWAKQELYISAMKSLTGGAILMCFRGVVKLFNNPLLPRNTGQYKAGRAAGDHAPRSGRWGGALKTSLLAPRLSNTGEGFLWGVVRGKKKPVCLPYHGAFPTARFQESKRAGGFNRWPTSSCPDAARLRPECQRFLVGATDCDLARGSSLLTDLDMNDAEDVPTRLIVGVCEA